MQLRQYTKHIPLLMWPLFYVALLPAINWGHTATPLFDIVGGGLWTPLSLITGLVLVARDFVQRAIGHYVFIPLIIGVILSYMLAGPEIALASGLAFLVSEVVDWGVYSYTRKPLSQRIMLSSTLSAPIDTAVFLYGAEMVNEGIFSIATLIASIVSKLAGAWIVAQLVKRREVAYAITA